MGGAVPSNDRRVRVRPILRLLLADLAVLLCLTIGPLGAVSLWGYARAMDDTAHAKAHESLRHMASDLHEHVSRHQRTADAAARLCVLDGGDGCRSEAMHATLAALAPKESSFRSLGLAMGDGWILDIAPVAEGFMTEECRRDGTKTLTNTLTKTLCRDILWSPARERLVSHGEAETERPDIRERLWYRDALLRTDGRWGAPFLQKADGALINRYRMTYARKVEAHEAPALAGAVVESALSLDQLLSDIRAMQPSPGTLTLITDAESRPILLPPLPEFRGIEATPIGRPIGPDFLPLADRVVAGAAKEGQLSIAGADYYLTSLRFDGEPGIDWTISMGIPASELLVGPRRVAWIMFGVASLVVLLVLWRAVALARRFSAPLLALAASTERMTDGDAIEVPKTDIAEVDALGARFLEASAAVRERAQFEAERRHTQRMATIGTLAGGVVHDINNQLTVLLGALSLARTGDENAELDVAESAASACAELTRGLLAFSRGGSAIGRTPIDVNELVRKTAQLLGATLRTSGVDVAVELAASPSSTVGDRVLLEQVLLNLALNARDAMPKGGRLVLATSRRGVGEVVVSVTDTGVGIAPEIQAKIFDAFFTTKETGKGTGLGLSIAHGIVSAHGGKVEIDSTPCKGSTFTVVLPAAPIAAPRPTAT